MHFSAHQSGKRAVRSLRTPNTCVAVKWKNLLCSCWVWLRLTA